MCEGRVWSESVVATHRSTGPGQFTEGHSSIVSLCLNLRPARSAAR